MEAAQGGRPRRSGAGKAPVRSDDAASDEEAADGALARVARRAGKGTTAKAKATAKAPAASGGAGAARRSATAVADEPPAVQPAEDPFEATLWRIHGRGGSSRRG
jgi:hypothetical protein